MRRLEKVSVAILSWNGRHHLEICLPALARQIDPGVAWEILVLDNGSADGTVEWVRREHPEVRVIESEVNLGFCAGNNRLVEEATGDAVALLNNDTRPKPDWLRAFVEALGKAPDDVAALSGLIVDWEGKRLDFAQGIMTFDGHAFQLGFRRPLDEVELPSAGSELFFACGGNMMIWRQSFLDAGGFDADYFAYLEDVDLGWRLWAGGERVLFAPQAVVHHRSGATSDLLGLYNRGFLFERNAFLTAYKNFEAGLWERLMPAVMLTFEHRTQTLLESNNPGGANLAIDPYAGMIADTGVRAPQAPSIESTNGFREPPTGDQMLGALRERWQRLGARGLVRRGIGKFAERFLDRPDTASAAQLTDERSLAQLRAQSYLMAHLDKAAAKRRRVQARRRRSDVEIFRRFPLYLVPTYPGDEALFASAGFQSWLPLDLPLKERTLDEVMEMK